MTYEDLLKEADSSGIIVKEKPLRAYKGRIKGNKIAIKEDLNNDNERRCVLAEELGHYHTSCGNILDQSKLENRKQELRARKWGYERLVGIIDIINAYKYGVKNRHELAEYLNVTEEFIEEVIVHYRCKYGLYFKVDNYVVYFDPLAVMEIWE